jgi:NACalpha-BTF3-like transcription factor
VGREFENLLLKIKIASKDCHLVSEQATIPKSLIFYALKSIEI